MSRFIEMFGGLPINGTISDLVEKNLMSVKKFYKKEDQIEYIDISSIDNSSNSINETTFYKVKDAPSRAQQCVRLGDILVSTVRPINRNIAIVTKDLHNLVASTGFCVLRPKPGYTEYLLSIVKSDSYTEQMCDKTSGGVYPAVNNGDVLSYSIHIPNKELLQEVTTICKHADKSEFADWAFALTWRQYTISCYPGRCPGVINKRYNYALKGQKNEHKKCSPNDYDLG